MTIIALSENKKGLSLSAFNTAGDMVAGNFVIGFENATFKSLVSTVASYVGQYFSTEQRPVLTVQESHSSLVEFILKDVSALGLMIAVAKGESHADMAKSTIAMIEEAQKQQMQAQQEAAANEEASEPVSGEETPEPETEPQAEEAPKPRRKRTRKPRKSKRG